MNPSKLLIPTLALSLFAAATANAVIYTDNFNRANTVGQTSASSPNLIGTQYTIFNGTWQIAGNQLQNNAAGGFMYYNQAQSTNTGAFSFSLLSTLNVENNVGLTYNFVDASNYQVLRLSLVSTGIYNLTVTRVVGGATSLLTLSSNIALAVNTYYDLGVYTTAGAGSTFNWTLNQASTSLSLSGSYTAANTNGYAGFFRTGGTGYWDSFSLTTVPEPSSASLVLLSLAGFAVRRRLRKSR